MKIYIGKYRHRWVSYVHERYMDKKHGRGWEESSTRFELFLEKVEDGLQWVYNHTINLYLDKRSGQKTKIRIDKYDTWSMDHTLAPIIAPMLKQLKETKHGAPYVDLKDVPKELHGKKLTKKQKDNGEVDDKHFERWDWVMDEMIFAFEQKCRDSWEEQFETGEYDLQWKKLEDGKSQMVKGPNHTAETDWEGKKAYQERMSNGFRLFGKYYESLWD